MVVSTELGLLKESRKVIGFPSTAEASAILKVGVGSSSVIVPIPEGLLFTVLVDVTVPLTK